MNKTLSFILAFAWLGTMPAGATDLTIQLSGSQALSRKFVKLDCGNEGTALGLPSKPFTVEYVNGAGNSLAILPIHEQSLIFVSVMSGSGTRYASGWLLWWDAGSRGVPLSSDSLTGKKEVACRRVEPDR